MINQYVIKETLGSGTFGKVKLCVRKMGEKELKFAIKILKKSYLKRQREMYRDESGSFVYLLNFKDFEPKTNYRILQRKSQ